MARDTFNDEIRAAMSGMGQPPDDLTRQYNTQLAPSQERLFMQSPYATDTYDYDARGEYAAGANRDNATGHGGDQFKKPNHPTFSDQSMYATPDQPGGTWAQRSDGTYAFIPSATNLDYRSPAELKNYLTEQEPLTKLMMPRRR